MTEDTLSFQAEVGRILDLMVHSVYSNKEIFLRELISNASDACDRLRYAAITQPELAGEDGEFHIDVRVDKSAGTITVSDNGIGMNREDMVENLGTIARSGTAAFAAQLSGDARKDVALIGQFGVGFYSAFMVAETVDVVSRRAGDDQAWRWQSDGKGTFTIAEAGKEKRGTEIVLHVKKDETEFLEVHRLRHIVKTYSDHIAVPVRLLEGTGERGDPVNAASALWTRAKSEVSDEQYAEFYHHVAHAFDEPWLTLHWRAEGRIEYSALLFIPTSKPLDLFRPERKPGVKLYVRRVFITDECDAIVPGWLRFLRGVVDSEDLPLNISREMLQHNPVLTQIRAGIVRRVLGDLERKADKEPEAYAVFWDSFGAVLKEGIYEDHENRDALLKLSRFHSTAGGNLVSLPDYLARMRPGQDAIYYISGDDVAALRKSPQIEGFAARNVEVLLLDHAVDEFWISSAGTFEGKNFKSVTRGGADLSAIAPDPESEPETGSEEDQKDISGLVSLFKLTLGDAVKDVRSSVRLTESAVCLVADEGDLDMHLERLLKAHGQTEKSSPRVLELNPKHALIKRLAERLSEGETGDMPGEMAWLLLDQARIVEGEPLPDPVAFSQRLSRFLQGGLR